MELKFIDKLKNYDLSLIEFDDKDPKDYMAWYKRSSLGQLSTKLEAAGKIRVFALVDV
jgi:hypothetical protein